MVTLTFICTWKLLPVKSKFDKCEITEAFRFRRLMSVLDNIPLDSALTTFVKTRWNVGRFGIPFIELMATSEKFLRIFLLLERIKFFISGRSSSSSFSFNDSFIGTISGICVISTSITSSFRCHLIGCRSVDPTAACSASPLITRTAPRNPNSSRRIRTNCGMINIPNAVPA